MEHTLLLIGWGIALVIAAIIGGVLGFALHWTVTYHSRMVKQRSEALYNRIVSATPIWMMRRRASDFCKHKRGVGCSTCRIEAERRAEDFMRIKSTMQVAGWLA